MENSYGIGVANRYALFLDEEEDPLELLKVHELEKEAKKKTKLSEKENEGGKPAEPKGGKAAPAAAESKAGGKGTGGAAPAPGGAAPVRKGIKETQNVKADAGKAREENNKTKQVIPGGDRPERKPRFGGEPREERNNRFNREDRPAGGDGGGGGGSGGFNRSPRDNAGEERRGGRGGGGQGGGFRGTDRLPRGGARGAPGHDNRGKREFDRQSGSDRTGVKAVDKREGGGAHNWGNPLKDDVQEQLNTSEEPLDWSGEKPFDWATEKVEGGEAPAAADQPTEAKDETAVEGEAVTPAAEEPVELTLDEYKALRSARQKPTYNLRKAGEGEDLSQWKPMYAVVKKKAEGADDEEDDEEYEVAEYPQRVGRQKHVLDIDIHFADSRRGGGGGGGRGGGRGRGGPRGAPREGGGGRGGYRSDDGPREPRGPPAPREPRESGGGGERGERGERSGGEDRPPADRPFRGGRGGGGFRGGERFPRGETSYAGRTPRQTAPKVDDEKAFPSLG